MFTKRTIAASIAAAMLATGFVAQTTVPAAANGGIPLQKLPIPGPKQLKNKPKQPPLKPFKPIKFTLKQKQPPLKPFKPIKLKLKQKKQMQPTPNWGQQFAAGAAGFMIGAAMASAARAQPAEESYDTHVGRCEMHYRTYDPETDTFMGYDGWRHRCRL